MSDTRDREIAELEARIMALWSRPDPEPAAPEAAPEPAPERDPDVMPAGWAALHEELAELEPEPSTMYYGYQHPDEAHELALASGHGVGGHPGLGAGVSN